MKPFELTRVKNCHEAVAGRTAFGALFLTFLYEMQGGMAADPPVMNWGALCVLSGTAVVGALVRWKCPGRKMWGRRQGAAGEVSRTGLEKPGPKGVAPGVQATACAITGSEMRQRRLPRAAHRVWDREDGFTLAGSLRTENQGRPVC